MLEKVPKKGVKKPCPNNLDKKIKGIMECFDFDHVETVMSFDKVCREYNDEGQVIKERPWYLFHKGYLVRPNVEELKEIAMYLFNNVKEHLKKYPRTDFFQTATGPFEVTYYKDSLKLSFVVANWYEED